MPFENILEPPQKIAVIGGGISGMGAAYFLAPQHRITLFEENKRLGGHARTLISGKNGDQPVDTGFIVFNYANYPHLTKLFDALDVPVKQSNMSFGVSANNGQVEYATHTLGAFFAQNRNLVNPAFYRMMRDIFRFNKHALAAAEDPELSISGLLRQLGLGKWFQEYYLLPISGAIWSTPLHQMMSFPAQSLVRFFDNHNLLGVYGQHQWYTVDGGSIEYVKRLKEALKHRLVETRLDAGVTSVRRSEEGVFVKTKGGNWEAFDRVVFACHSDTALSLLEKPSEDEQRLLSKLRYQDNRAILHCDPNVMPKRKSCWSSWIYSSSQPKPAKQIGVTYWMNKLQSIPADDLLLETLNPCHDIKDELIYDEKTFRHPVFDHAALNAQQEITKIQGYNNTWFCGAYMGSGFHEDGLASAVKVAQSMDSVPIWA